MWYQRFDPPASKSPRTAAKNTARAVGIHVKNVKEIRAGRPAIHFYGEEQSLEWLEDAVRMAYQFPNQADRVTVEEKPKAPAVCVWDVMAAADKQFCRDEGFAPE